MNIIINNKRELNIFKNIILNSLKLNLDYEFELNYKNYYLEYNNKVSLFKDDKFISDYEKKLIILIIDKIYNES